MKLTSFFFRIQWSSRIYPLHILWCYASTPSRNTSFLPRESDVVQGQPVIPLSRRCGFGGWRWWDGLEVRMCKGDRDELMVSKDIRIGMVREMVFFPKSFQISEVTWVVKIHGIRMILATFHENRDTCVNMSVVIIETHVAEWWNWTLSARMYTSPDWYTKLFAPFQLDLRAQNYLPSTSAGPK